jgi:hypothetical protein
MVLDEPFPRLRLARLHPGEHVGREKGPRSVVPRGVSGFVEPSVRRKMGADLTLERGFVVKAHAATKTRVSIWPVTAEDITPALLSCNKLIA